MSWRTQPSRRDRHPASSAKPVGAGSLGRSSNKTAVPPPTLREGQVRCPVCRNGATVTSLGNLREHRDLFGYTCSNRRPADVVIDLTDLPPVILSPPPRVDVSVTGRRPTGECHECSKRIPPGRLLCGRCFSRRGSS